MTGQDFVGPARERLCSVPTANLDVATALYSAVFHCHAVSPLRKRLDELLIDNRYDDDARFVLTVGYSYLPMQALREGSNEEALRIAQTVCTLGTDGLEEAQQRFIRYRLLIVRFFADDMDGAEKLATLVLASEGNDAAARIMARAINGIQSLRQGALHDGMEQLSEIFATAGLTSADRAPGDLTRVIVTHEGLQVVPFFVTTNECTVLSLFASELIDRRAIDEALELQNFAIGHSRTNVLGNVIWTNNLAVSLIDAFEYTAAIGILNQVVALHEQSMPARYRAYVLHNLGRAHAGDGRPDEGFRWLDESLALAQTESDAELVLDCLTQRARIHLESGNLDEASRAIDSAPFEENGIGEDTRARYRFVCELLRSLRGQAADVHVAAEAIEVLRRENHTTEATQLLYDLSGICARLGDNDGAYECLRRHTEERINRVARDSERRLQMLGVQQQIDLLHREKRMMQEREIERQARFDELEQKFGAANQSLMLTWNSLHELERNIETAMHEVRESKDLARTLRTLIRDSPVLGGSWESYLSVFTEVHPHFVRSLHNAAPNLTKMETKVCILTMAEMKSDDIAALLYLSSRTIETHRLSIRRKLNVPKQYSLLSFLKGLGVV